MKKLILLLLLFPVQVSADFFIDKLVQPIKTISTIGDKSKPRAVTHVEVGDRRGLDINMISVRPSAILDTTLELSEGNVPGHYTVNKFGRASNVDSGIITDIHDCANATDDVDIWVAPTAARVHNISSTSGSDDGDPAGVGARIVKVYGLQTWDTAETSEEIILNGTTDVPTTVSYVIVHRIKVISNGATNINVGNITATAAVDNTVTAKVLASQGQTQMAVYGIPSTQKAHMTNFYASSLRANQGATNYFADIRMVYNPNPKVTLTRFQVKHTIGLATSGSSLTLHRFAPYKSFTGPGIMKIQGIGSTNNMDISAGFDLILVDN